jgi:chromosome partitioning protein
MKTFAIANQKGGVAKSTNTINVAGGLADRGSDVVVADLDPQGYLTNTLNLRDEYVSDEATLFTAMNDPGRTSLEGIIVEHDEFDVVPSNVDMFRLEQELIASGRRPRLRLRQLLDDLSGYEYIIVDAPPSLGPINDNVLLACQNLLVPVEAAQTSILAIEHLLNQIESLEVDYDIEIEEQAILISNVNYPLDNEQHSAIEWFTETFEGRCPIFEIRHRAAIKRSLNAGGSIYGDDAEETDMSDVYEKIADHLETIDDD